MKIPAIYARVSSDQQREVKTMARQTAALIEFSSQENYQVPDEWVFEDEGYSGASLIRPGLERIGDLANADTLDIGQRQRIMRLLIKEVIVGKDLITIKHSIPRPAALTDGNPQSSKPPIQHNTIKVILCVRGLITAPCGVPAIGVQRFMPSKIS